MKPIVKGFFESVTNTISYVVYDSSSRGCAIIDSVANFDYNSGKLSYESADEIIEFIRANGLKNEWIIETHVHADHLTAAPYLKENLGGKVAISEKIGIIQNTFGEIFDEGPDFKRDGSQFDYLFKDNEEYKIGNLSAKAIATPGHTPACMTHIIGDAAFVGDTLFMPDGGTARADFPGGDAKALYESIEIILSLPSETRLFMCHDYAPNSREIMFESDIESQRNGNIHVKSMISKDEFVEMRTKRDATLDMPRLILPSLQINMKAGQLPKPVNNKIFLKVPINAF